jgi:hypothetical protein
MCSCSVLSCIIRCIYRVPKVFYIHVLVYGLAFLTAQILLNGPGTLERRLAINVALHIAVQANVFQPLKLDLLLSTVRKMEAMSTLQARSALDLFLMCWVIDMHHSANFFNHRYKLLYSDAGFTFLCSYLAVFVRAAIRHSFTGTAI